VYIYSHIWLWSTLQTCLNSKVSPVQETAAILWSFDSAPPLDTSPLFGQWPAQGCYIWKRVTVESSTAQGGYFGSELLLSLFGQWPAQGGYIWPMNQWIEASPPRQECGQTCLQVSLYESMHNVAACGYQRCSREVWVWRAVPEKCTVLVQGRFLVMSKTWPPWCLWAHCELSLVDLFVELSK